MLKKITLILLFAVVIVSCFSILFISAQSNFATNISGWRAVHGEWTETENGYNGSSGYPSLAISDQLVSSSAAFTYSGDVTHGDGGLSIIKVKRIRTIILYGSSMLQEAIYLYISIIMMV